MGLFSIFPCNRGLRQLDSVRLLASQPSTTRVVFQGSGRVERKLILRPCTAGRRPASSTAPGSFLQQGLHGSGHQLRHLKPRRICSKRAVRDPTQSPFPPRLRCRGTFFRFRAPCEQEPCEPLASNCVLAGTPALHPMVRPTFSGSFRLQARERCCLKLWNEPDIAMEPEAAGPCLLGFASRSTFKGYGI